MAEAKTIKLLLSDGSLAGLLVAELSKWDGILLSSPRESYQLLSNEQESKYWGVYLLVSEDKVYIGQTNDLLRRISEHDKTKDWWNRVVLFTTKDNSLNRSDIDYLENSLIEIAKRSGSIEMSNSQQGNTPKVSRYRETELKDYLVGGLLLLELIGIRVFLSNINKGNHNLLVNSKTVINKPIIPEHIKFYPSKIEMTKSEAVRKFRSSGIKLDTRNITFASFQEIKKAYWANPRIEQLNEEWYIILNNQYKRTLKLLSVPPNTFSAYDNDNSNRLILRKDRPEMIDLNLQEPELVDIRSKADFSNYYLKTLEY